MTSLGMFTSHRKAQADLFSRSCTDAELRLLFRIGGILFCAVVWGFIIFGSLVWGVQ